MIDFIDKTTEKNGTPLNRQNMMAIQGFADNTITFNDDNSITETNFWGQKKTTRFEDGKIIEVFEGDKTITKTTTFNTDGSISEVLS